MAQPGADITCNPLLTGESVSPWTCRQERAHKLSAYAKQPPVGGHCVGEGISHVNAWSVPHYKETSDDDNYQPSLGTQSYSGTHEPSLAHSGITRGCQEQLSRRDWYEAPARPTATTCCGLGACQTITPSTVGTNARIPRRWKCDARHVQ